MLILVLPERSGAFLRPLVQGPADRRLDVLAAVFEGRDLRIWAHARISERTPCDPRVVGVLLGLLRGLPQPFDRVVRLREVLDVGRDDPLVVHEEDGRTRLAPAVADHGLVLGEADLVRSVLDDVRDGVLAAEGHGLLHDPGGEVFHRITSSTRSGAGSSARPGSRRALGPDRIYRRTRPRNRGPSRRRRPRTRRRAS